VGAKGMRQWRGEGGKRKRKMKDEKKKGRYLNP
jgi:hypothetical protein